jgi:hypothetical protein
VSAVASSTPPAVRGSMDAIATPSVVGHRSETLGKVFGNAKSP